MATICLDPGHGGPDAGAVRNGLAEKEVTLDIALAARDALQPRHRVTLTRDVDRSLTPAERRRVADEAEADISVSIHVNAAARPQAHGFEVLVRQRKDTGGAVLAADILEAIADRFPDRRNRGIKPATLAVLRQTRPACLVECFFISNPEERSLLAGPEIRAALGEAIARGCDAFVRGPGLTARAVPAAASRGRTERRATRSPRRPAPPPA